MTLVGCEVPRLFTPPARELTPATTRGFEVIAFAEDVMGLTLMPWQRWLLEHLLELAEDGTYRFRTGVVITARQSGKSTLLQVLALWRMYVDAAPLVLGCAQNLALAEETWAGALSMAESVPELAAEVAHVSRTNGDKFMRLTSGERYKVAAATRSGSRGLSSDLVLLDELREHRDYEAWASSTKTTMARPSPQTIAFSNAGDAGSVVLADLRGKALAAAADRSTRLGLFEWSAPDGCALDDREAWAQANPALGHRMTEDAIAAALEVDPETVFRVEVLCQWVTAVESAIPAAVWDALADPGADRGDDVVFALDVAPDHSAASLAVAWRRADGAAQVMLADHRVGVDWVVGRAADVTKTWDARPVPALDDAQVVVGEHRQGFDWVVARAAEVTNRWDARLIVEQAGTAGFLLPALEAADGRVELVPRRFYVDACAALDAAVAARQVRHGNQPELNAAIAVARWSTSGEAGQRVLSRKDPRVSPLVAAALALHGLTLPKPVTGGWMIGVR